VPLIIGVACIAFPLEWIIPFVVILAGIMLGFFIISVTYPEDHRFLTAVFLGALLLRIAVCILIFFSCISVSSNSPITRAGFFLGDSFAYSYNGWWIAQQWLRGYYPDALTIIKHGMSNTLSNYDYWNAGVYYVIGHSPLAVMFINCLCGALTALLAYLIAKEIYGRNTARISCIICAFWPSLFFWSTQNLKEPIAIFLIGLILYCTIRLRRGFGALHFGMLTLSFWALFYWHKYIFIILGAAVIFSFLFYSTSSRKNLLIFFIVLLCGYQFLQIWVSSVKQGIFKADPFLKTFSKFEQINYLRSVRSFGGSMFVPIDISTPQALYTFLLSGFFLVWLVPFPWKLGGSIILVAACPEMLIWYLMIPFALKGIIFSFSEKWNKSSVIIIFLFFGTVMLALIEGNVGTLFRHRSMLMPYALILTASGIARTKGQV
jgi:4-amino-4-deoxy-L-arabinose transferase-like glycosyltransferase